jgi:nucleoside-diphosphate-sugar epimerase
MKVLVTGANGLLGHHVVMELKKRNISVKIIVRSLKNIYFNIEEVEVMIGNFTMYEDIKQAALGCDAIIHIAAATALDYSHYSDYELVNINASRQLLKIASELLIKDIVYVSTANTIGFGNKKHHANENASIRYPFSLSYYAKSKLAAERLFQNQAKDKHIVIINPTFMVGSFDTKPSSGKLLLMGYGKRFLFIPRGGKNFVSVSDVAIACCNALTMGVSGERYLAAGTNLSFKKFYKLQSSIGGYPQIIIKIPNFLLIIVALTGDIMSFFKIKTSLTSINLKQLLIREYYLNTKARKELMMPVTPIEEAVKEALQWFKAKSYIKK